MCWLCNKRSSDYPPYHFTEDPADAEAVISCSKTSERDRLIAHTPSVRWYFPLVKEG